MQGPDVGLFVVVGIDLAVARGKLLPVCFASRGDHGFRLLPRSRGYYPRGPGNEQLVRDPDAAGAFAESVADFLQTTSQELGLPIVRIAIDAPRSPRPPGARARSCEVMLGLNLFKTPNQEELDAIRDTARRHLDRGGRVSRLPNANRIWMLVGFALFRALEARRWRCVEVYPFATMTRVFRGGRVPSKKTADGRRQQLDRLLRLTGNRRAELGDLSRLGPGSAHDRIDAFGAAWVASLRPAEYQDVGSRGEDRIRVPRHMA